jgi:hypothetical protein
VLNYVEPLPCVQMHNEYTEQSHLEGLDSGGEEETKVSGKAALNQKGVLGQRGGAADGEDVDGDMQDGIYGGSGGVKRLSAEYLLREEVDWNGESEELSMRWSRGSRPSRPKTTGMYERRKGKGSKLTTGRPHTSGGSDGGVLDANGRPLWSENESYSSFVDGIRRRGKGVSLDADGNNPRAQDESVFRAPPDATVAGL